MILQPVVVLFETIALVFSFKILMSMVSTKLSYSRLEFYPNPTYN